MMTGGIVVLTILTFAVVTQFNFVLWDDPNLIVFNPLIRSMSWTNIVKIFTSYDPELYVPLTTLSHAIDFALAGTSPIPYHLGNLILHTMNALLVTWLLFLIIEDKWLSWLGGAIFAVHPLQAEAVAWASARKDVLASVFFLVSIIAYLYATDREDVKWWIVSIGSFLLSLLAKVTGLALPLILIFIDVTNGRRLDRKSFLEKIPFLVLSSMFAAIAIFGKTQTLVKSSLTETILMAGASTMFAIRSFLVPKNLSVLYPLDGTITIANPTFFIPIIAILVACSIIFLSWNRDRRIALGSSFFLFTLAPTFINFAKGDDIYLSSDRYVYLPMIGLLIISLALIDRLTAWKPQLRSATIGSIAGVGVVGLALAAHAQALTWKDTVTLFTRAIDASPNSVAAHVNLAIAEREIGNLDSAMDHATIAANIRPSARAETTIATIAKRKGQMNDAIAAYRRALTIDVADSESHFGLGIIFASQGKVLEARAEYEAALAADPSYTAVRLNLGALFMDMGKLEDAAAQFIAAMDTNPALTDAAFNLAVVRRREKKLDEAIAILEQAHAMGPDMTDIALFLAGSYLDAGRAGDALGILQKIIDHNPENAEAKQILIEMEERGMIRRK
jgi:tetratricopeptide (TPR) repeat protein